MPAAVIDAKYATLIGTPEQIRSLLNLLAGDGTQIVDVKFSNFVVTDRPVDLEVIRAALATVPQHNV